MKPRFGHWQIIDRGNGKMIVGYSLKSDADITADGLNNEEDVPAMIKTLQTIKGYGYYIRLAKSKR